MSDHSEKDQQENIESDDDSEEIQQYDEKTYGGKDLIDDDGEDESAGEYEDKIAAWGTDKKAFYNEEEGRKSDEEAEAEEEKEAKLIEKLHQETLQEKHFLDVFVDAKQHKKGDLEHPESEFEIEDDDVAIEKKEMKDLEKLSDPQKLAAIKINYPELVNLIDEYRRGLDELENRTTPYLEEMNTIEAKNKFKKELNFLNAKFNLLTSYCMNLSYYFLLKSKGKSIEDHPVIRKLVEIKKMLSKIQRLDPLYKTIGVIIRQNKSLKINEMKNSIGKAQKLEHNAAVIKTLKNGSVIKNDVKPVTINEVKEVKKVDKVHKPKPKKNTGKSLAILDYLDDEDEKDRLQVNIGKKNKKDTKLPKKKPVNTFNVDDDDDLGLDDSLLGDEFNEDDSMDDLDDEDAPPKKQKNKKGKSNDKKLIGKHPRPTANDNDNDENEDDYYREVKKIKKDRNDGQIQEKDHKTASKLKEKPWYEVPEDGVRAISKKIMKNKGLTRRRPKIDRNPRVKRRVQYETAEKKLKTQGNFYREKTAKYGGELTGIRSGVMRGTALK